MSEIRQLKLGQREQLRQKIKTLEAQAANDVVLIEMKTYAYKQDLTKLDIDAILQAAKDLFTAITHLREAKALSEELNAELYD